MHIKHETRTVIVLGRYNVTGTYYDGLHWIMVHVCVYTAVCELYQTYQSAVCNLVVDDSAQVVHHKAVNLSLFY